MNRILFTAAQRAAGYFVEFNADGLLRGDFHTRMLGYQGAVGGPWMLRNEARRLESFGDIPGGDVLLENLNQSSGPPSPGALAEVTAEGLTADTPPNPAIELAAPSSRAEAFRPLLEATWSRILKRGAQDWPVVAKRGASGAAITDFWTGLDAFAADQLAPVAAALGCDAAVLGLPGSFVCEAHETPAGWDVPVMAREFAARNLETL